jgi:hypothetical protein
MNEMIEEGIKDEDQAALAWRGDDNDTHLMEIDLAP